MWPADLQEVALSGSANVLSVDLESWPETSCVEETLYLLDLFRRKKARATFFVLGSVATREPDLVRRVAAEGHEIASHGWDHEQLFKKTPAQFRDEMRRARDELSGLCGVPPMGFRAPHFSLNVQTSWALDALADAGFKYDSSIFPIPGPRYGVPDFPRAPVRITHEDRSIIEVPLSTVRTLGRNIPVAGGGYFRLMPYRVIDRAVRAVNAEGLPFVVYCHPYEFRRDPLACPPQRGPLGRARAAAKAAKFNLFRGTMRGKLARLLDGFRFTSFQEVLRGDAFGVSPAAREVAQRIASGGAPR